jgi:transposase
MGEAWPPVEALRVGYKRDGQGGCLESGIVVFGEEHPFRVREVIPVKSRAYRAVDVNGIDLAKWLEGRNEKVVHAGLDVGKEKILCTLRWGVKDFDRPWRVCNPSEAVRLAEVLTEVGRGRELIVAMEPTGTYGDPLRQALGRAGLCVHRVSPKNASDYAEVFDGVPSQHDGKDAAVVADLSAQGRSWPWPMRTPTEAEQELAYQVEWMDAQRRQMMLWSGKMEALLSRHWPEATRILPLGSGTLLRCLATHGGPQGLRATDALDQVRRWDGGTWRDLLWSQFDGRQRWRYIPGKRLELAKG